MRNRSAVVSDRVAGSRLVGHVRFSPALGLSHESSSMLRSIHRRSFERHSGIGRCSVAGRVRCVAAAFPGSHLGCGRPDCVAGHVRFEHKADLPLAFAAMLLESRPQVFRVCSFRHLWIVGSIRPQRDHFIGANSLVLLAHAERNFEISDDLLICQILKERFGKTITAFPSDRIFSTCPAHHLTGVQREAPRRVDSARPASTQSWVIRSGAPFGRRNGNYRHGCFTAEAKEQRLQLRLLIRGD